MGDGKVAECLNAIRHKWRNASGEAKFHIVLGVGLFFFLAWVTPIRWADPLNWDKVYTIRPYMEESPRFSLDGEWERSPQAFLARDKTATLRIETDRGPWRSIRLMINGDIDARWTVRLRRAYSGFTLLNVKPGEEIRTGTEEFSALAFSDEPIQVSLSPRNPPQGGARLDRVMVRLTAEEARGDPASIPGLLIGPLVPLGLALFLSRAGRRNFRQGTILAGLAGVALAGTVPGFPRALDFLWAAGTSFFLGTATASAFQAWRSHSAQKPEAAARQIRLAELCAIVSIMSIALWTRWDAFLDMWSLPPLPDAKGYLQIAREGGFYQTLQDHAPFIREPLFPALIRWWYELAPNSVTSARLLCMLIGLIPVGLTWFAGRRLFSPVVGLLAAAAMALNPILAEQSVSVLRDDLLIALFLALICVVVYTGQHPWWRAALFGLAGAGLVLTRVGSLFLLLPLGAIEAWRRRWRLNEIGLAAALVLLPVLPHLALNARQGDGDFLYSANVHTRYYLNRANIGEPGFPATMEEWEADPYAGEAAGSAALIGRAPLHQVIPATAWGYINIFAFRYPHGHLFFGHEWLMIFGLFGAWGLWRRLREIWWLIAWFLIFLFPIAVIAPIHLDYRLSTPAAPFILWVWALGIQEAALLVWKAFPSLKQKRGTPKSSPKES